jgi:hypothetical protein
MSPDKITAESTVYYGLNPVGGRIWNLIQQPRTVNELTDILLAEYEITPEACLTEVLTLLQDLSEHNLLVITDASPV